MRLLDRMRRAASLPPAEIERATSRPGYDASPLATLQRVRPMLVRERVAWLSTVRPNGLPHLVPAWYLWDGEALVVFSKPEAVKVRNLRSNPRLMVALGRPEEDFSVGLIEAMAVVAEGRARVPDDFFAKYGSELADAGLDRETFRRTYTQAIRIVPTRFLAWRGRGARHDEARAAAPLAVGSFGRSGVQPAPA